MADKPKIQELEERVDELERDSHPPIGLCEFEGYKDLVNRIEELEKLIKSLVDRNLI
jgi:hypothetical protein